MAGKSSDLVQGNTRDAHSEDSCARRHAWLCIAIRIEQISSGVFRVNPGRCSLLSIAWSVPARIKAEWRATENNRRAKYYLLTDSGRKALKDETREWGRQIAAIARIMEA